MSSWYDVYVPTTLENYAGLKGRQPLALIMGPWTHGSRSRSLFGDVDFGPARVFDGRRVRACTHLRHVDFGPAEVFDGQVDSDWLEYRPHSSPAG